MSKPLIGISTSLIIDQGGMFPGYERVYVNKDYVDSVTKNGGVPVMIPFNVEKDVLEQLMTTLDGLIISGGHDVYPLNYGEQPSQKLGDVFPERDEYEYFLLEKAKERNIPVLGICRGLQIINTYEGGTLYQDLSYIPGEILKHSQNQRPELKTHSVDFEAGSILSQVFGGEEFLVNSFHHQVLKDVAKDYKVTARAKDGVVEAIEHQNYPFLVGVQWHPEMLAKKCDDTNKLFKYFIDKTKK